MLETATADGAGRAVVLESAAAKHAASETVGAVAGKTVQIHGGAGGIADHGIERLNRDATLFRSCDGMS